MDGGKTEVSCVFEILFSKSVPHILEKIYFSLDYESFLACFRVNRTWNQLLSSESYQKKFDKLLIEKEKNDKKLWNISRKGNVDEVKRLLSSGGWIDVNCVDGSDQNTPLIRATWGNHKDVAQVLLNRGAEVDKANKHGLTALHAAAKSVYKDMVQVLLDGGAEHSREDNKGQTPLHLASISGHPNVVQLLLAKGADRNKVNRSGKTPLHLATESVAMCNGVPLTLSVYQDVVQLLRQ